MDRGFREWFAKLAVARIKENENQILKEEWKKQIIKEEQERTQVKRCGWTISLYFIKALSFVSAVLGVICGIWLLCGGLILIAGTSAFISCAWTPPKDQCLVLELHNRTSGETILTNEYVWGRVEQFTVWQNSVHIAFEEMLNNSWAFDVWNRVRNRVCPLVSEAGLTTWQKWAGVYKLP